MTVSSSKYNNYLIITSKSLAVKLDKANKEIKKHLYKVQQKFPCALNSCGSFTGEKLWESFLEAHCVVSVLIGLRTQKNIRQIPSQTT